MEAKISRIEEIIGDDVEMKKTIIIMFIETCDKAISEFARSISLSGNEAEKAWQNGCHELKGAALNLGFTDLGNYCSTIEAKALNYAQKKEAISVFNCAKDSIKELLNSL